MTQTPKQPECKCECHNSDMQLCSMCYHHHGYTVNTPAEYQHLQGFIAGADTTGSQAEEIMAEKIHEAEQRVREEIYEAIRNMPLETVGDSAKTLDQVLVLLTQLKNKDQ